MTRSALLALALTLFPLAASAQGTHLWSQASFTDFEHGTPEGVSILSTGGIEAGRASRLLATTDATYTWAVAADKQGNTYVATGSPATVTRIAPDGKQTGLFSTKALSVQCVRVGPDGAIYAATLPSGKVYRIPATATTEAKDGAGAGVVFDPSTTAEKPKYLWDMLFDPQGRLYIAAGGPAAIYRVAEGGKPELVYKSDEQHIRSLAFAPDGSLIAGTDGSGLVYRITLSTGKAYVLYEAPKREITSLAVAPSGAIYLSAVGEKGRSNLPPQPVTGAAAVTTTITIVQPGSVQAFNGNSVIPDGSEVYELSPAGTPRRLWSAHDDIVYALDWTPNGLLAATGNRGHLYRIGENGEYADIAHLDAGQAVGFAPTAQGLAVATANPAKLYLLEDKAQKSVFTSQVFDAQTTSRWGRAEVDAGSAHPGYQLEVRAGNVENPERGWSDWRPVTANAPTVGLEPARYLQWRATLAPAATLASVAVDYLPVNLAPMVDEMVVVPGARVNASSMQPTLPQQITINFPSAQNGSFEQNANSGPLAAIRDKTAITARWAAHDENGDDLEFALYYRADDQGEWRLLKDHLTDRFYSFDASLLPDGAWRMKVVASDAPSHVPGEALTGEHVSDRFLIDTATPSIPMLEARREAGKLHVTATATDPSTPIAHAEYSVDAGRWQYVEPTGKLSDALTEHYDFSVSVAPSSDSGEHIVTLRVYDRYDNVTAAKTVAH